MSIKEQLNQKLVEFKSLELAQSHLDKIETRIILKKKKLDQLHLILEKEYKDVTALEKLSIRTLFEKILGDQTTQLEEERQEYLQATLNYNETKKSLELLDYERTILRDKLRDSNKTKSELHSLIRQREKSLKIEDPLAKQIIVDLNSKIDSTILEKRELNEAIIAGVKLKGVINNIIKNLDEVILWGDYVLNPPDLHIKKHFFINKAKDHIQHAPFLLQQFEDELEDIYGKENKLINQCIGDFQNFIELFFKSLIKDWIINKKIRQALDAVVDIQKKVVRINSILKKDLQTAEKNGKSLEERKEKIILELN